MPLVTMPRPAIRKYFFGIENAYFEPATSAGLRNLAAVSLRCSFSVSASPMKSSVKTGGCGRCGKAFLFG